MKRLLEPSFEPRRIPYYLFVVAMSVALSIAFVCGMVAFSGGQSVGASNTRDHIRNDGGVVGTTARDSVGIFMLVFVLLYFTAPASASYLAIKGCTAILDFESWKWKVALRLFILVLVLATLWTLMPWISIWSNVRGELIPSRVVGLRAFHIILNIIVTVVLIRRCTQLK